MSSPKVPTFQPRVGQDTARGAENTRREGGDGSQVNVPAAIYNRPITRDEGDSKGQGGGGHDALVGFLAGANTAQLRTVARNVQQPLLPEGSVLSLLGPNARPAHFARKSRFEDGRRQWGDFLPGGSTRAKFSPLDGKAITFDSSDLPIRAGTPREVLAGNTTIDADTDRQVRHGVYEAHLNAGNPRKDRLQVYSLNGLQLRA